MDENTSLGMWIRRRRKALDLTREELAARVGYSAEMIRKIEADARRPSKQVAIRLAEQLLLDPAECEIFTRVSRAELNVGHLPPPTQSISLPPLRTLVEESNKQGPRSSRPPSQAGNLPALLTPLIGRERELSHLTGLLYRPEVRLVTLTGTGGVGKTHLALTVAATLLDGEWHDILVSDKSDGERVPRFPDGVWFVDLASVNDSAMVASAIARALGITSMSNASPEAGLIAFLQAKQLLLLLDNVEHLLPAVPLITDLMRSAPRLTVLVTSRTPLHLSGEQELLIEPLEQSPAVTLFVSKAQAVSPHLVLLEEHRNAVEAIVHQVDRLPLAIELAAARTKILAPHALQQMLEHEGSLPLLTGGARDLPARQRTIRATIAWSYGLLQAHEQLLFRRLGVFIGGFSLQGAHALASASNSPPHELSLVQTLDTLNALVDHSLVRRLPDVEDEPRFTLLETIRAYTLELLAVHGEVAEAQYQHAKYMMQFAEMAEPHLAGSDQGVWRRRVAADHANIETALGWSMSADGDTEVGLRIASALLWYWKPLGYRREALSWLDTLLAPSNTIALPVRAKALHASALLAGRQGQYERAKALLEEAAALYRKLGNHQGVVDNLLWLSSFAREQGNYSEAERLVAEMLKFAQAHNVEEGVFCAIYGLGDIALEQGYATQALSRYQEVLPLVEKFGNEQDHAWLIANMGRAAVRSGDISGAYSFFTDAFSRFQRAGLQDGITYMHFELGYLAWRQGDVYIARHHLSTALSMGHNMAILFVMAQSLEMLAGVWTVEHNAERAARLLGAAASIRNSISNPVSPAERAEYDQITTAVREDLGDDRFALAFAAGKTLTVDQAVTEALLERTA